MSQIISSILVTGVAGFIGSHIAEKLLIDGKTVIGIDNLNDYYPVEYKKDNLRILEQHSDFKFHKLDLSDFNSLKQVFEDNKIDYVAHLAARAGVRPSIKDPFIYEQTNVKGTLNLLSLSASSEVKNFVLSSSSSVYGNSKEVPFKENDSATDLPISPYAATKKASEVLAYTFHHLYKLNVNVIRPFTVYGPRGRPDMAPWLFLSAAIKGEQIKKFGEGDTRRDYTYIDDFVKGFISAINTPLGYEIFNLGNSKTVSLNEAIETIEKVADKKLDILQIEKQPGDVDLTYADISKARELLNYNPETSFEEGMSKFAQWFKQNRI